MRLLLDTHVWIWWRFKPERLNSRVIRMIEPGKTEVFVSAVSVWEIAIKVRRGRLKFEEPLEGFLGSRFAEERFEELPISMNHAARTVDVPETVRDPFDRLLIAQARCEDLTLVTGDRRILKSGGNVMAAT